MFAKFKHWSIDKLNMESDTSIGPGTSTSTGTGSHLDAGLLFALAVSFNVSELELWLKRSTKETVRKQDHLINWDSLVFKQTHNTSSRTWDSFRVGY